MSSNIPAEAPPSYDAATGGSSASSRPSASHASSTLGVPVKGGISDTQRKSMEDEMRPLPPGWVRTMDPGSHHQFFVDTTKEPPRSIWHHPYDDEEYLATLSSEERERLEHESMQHSKHPTKDDIIAAHSDDDEPHTNSSTSAQIPTELPPRPSASNGKGKAPEKASFGRRFKDKMTGTTHEERIEARRKMAEQQQQAYEDHVKIRQAMATAAQTGQPVHLGKDNTGRDVYIEPPYDPYRNPNAFPPGLYSYDPYGRMGVYTTSNARYVRPQAPFGQMQGPYGRPPGPYGRPYNSGYGGYGRSGPGAGTGLALGAGLGLLLGGAFLF